MDKDNRDTVGYSQKKTAETQDRYSRKSTNVKYNVYVSTNPGKVRSNNEDNFAVNTIVRRDDRAAENLRGYLAEEPLLCAVFDGMGGEANGDVCSKISALEAEKLFNRISACDTLLSQSVDDYVFSCNTQIIEMLRRNNKKRGGSTFVMAYFCGGLVHTFSLGDSRIYLYRDKTMRQISKDHTLAMKKYEANIYSKQEANQSPDSHKLTAFLGLDNGSRSIKAEKYDAFQLEKGDRLLLCSDGLYDMCSDKEILHILSKNSDSLSYMLVKAAIQNGGEDNITCLIIEPSDES